MNPISGIETLEPAFGLPAIWIDEATKERAELSGYTVVDPPSVVATHLTELLRNMHMSLLDDKKLKLFRQCKNTILLLSMI